MTIELVLDGLRHINLETKNRDYAGITFDAIQEIEKMQKRVAKLDDFLDWILESSYTGSDIYGGDAQDKAYELGILAREIYDPSLHTLSQGAECDAGDYIYFRAPKEKS